MATTNITFDRIWDYDGKTRIFKTFDGPLSTLWVKSYEDGIVTIDPTAGTTITQFAKVLAGCFNEYSNFEFVVKKAFKLPAHTAFTGIRFTFNGATVLVTHENCNKIYEMWQAEMDATAERERLKREAWLQTEEGQAYLAEEREKAAREKAIADEVRKIDETTEMEFKDEEAKKSWEKMVKKNSKDFYSLGVVVYARRWAKYMQTMIAQGKTVAEIAKDTSFDADLDGITGFMYGCAVSMLAECWKWGEELRKWHNGQYGHEDSEGTVNPESS